MKIISSFIEKSKINIELIQSFNLEREARQKILMILAKFSKYIFFEKEKEIFKLGDPADNFFIIFSGSIKNYKLSKYSTFLNKQEYIKKLFELKSNNDCFILRKTLSFNHNLYINEYEIERLYEKLMKIEEIKYEVNFKTHKKLFVSNKYAGTFEQYVEDIKNGDVPENLSDEEIKSRLYDSSFPSPIDKMDDEHIFDKRNTKTIFFNYELISVMKEGEYFAENGDNPNRRIHHRYCIPEEDTICLSISNGIFQKYITCEIQKLKNKEISFLNDNQIFKAIQRGTFLNNYLKYFIREEFPLGTVIFEEEKPLEKIYFLKEGKMELSLHTNFLGLNKYANELLNANEEIHEVFKHFQLNPDIKNQPKYFMENLRKKQNYSIFLLSENDITGLEECCYDFKHLYTATIKSDKAVLYSILIKKFKKIIELEPKAKLDFKSNSLLRMTNLINRLQTLKNNSLQRFDDKYSEEISGGPKTAGDPNSLFANMMKKIKKENFYCTENNDHKNVKASIRKFYDEFTDLSKHLKKKYEMILNPPIDEYTFYNDFKYEKSTIKNIKREIKNLKNNSIYNILPDIKQFSQANFNNVSLGFNNNNSQNSFYLKKDELYNKISSSDNVNQFLEKSINNKSKSTSLDKNEKEKQVKPLGFKINSEIKAYKVNPFNFKEKKFDNKSTINSTFFMTNLTKLKIDNGIFNDYGFKGNEASNLNNTKVINESENNFTSLNTDQIINKHSNTNRNTFISTDNKNIKYRKDGLSNLLHNEEIKNKNKQNLRDSSYYRNSIRNKNTNDFTNISFKQNINSNRNIFIPFAVDNSINTIKNQDRKMQMSMAKRVYKYQTYYNF